MIIYKITNNINGKTYIGQTRKTVAERIRQHIYSKSKVGKDIIDYGIDSFNIDVIDSANSQDELDELERFWISFYNSQVNGYNTLSGGKPTKNEFRMLSKFNKGTIKHSKKFKEKQKKREETKREKQKYKAKPIEYHAMSDEQFNAFIDSLKEYRKAFFVKVL